MKPETLDRRVRRTRKLLRECLIALLKTKKVQDITVRELTERADLNRGTFYLHYKDVFDLLEKTEEDLQEDFNRVLSRHQPVDLTRQPSAIFQDIYTLVYENSDLIEILLGENGDLKFVTHLKNLIREKCLKEWIEISRSGNPASFDAFSSFIVSGCVGLAEYWIKNGLKETPEQMARLAEQIITKGMGVLQLDPYESCVVG